MQAETPRVTYCWKGDLCYAIREFPSGVKAITAVGRSREEVERFVKKGIGHWRSTERKPFYNEIFGDGRAIPYSQAREEGVLA